MSHHRVNTPQGWLTSELERRGVSRREFLGFCATTAAVLALPDVAVGQIADALLHVDRPPVLEGDTCECFEYLEEFAIAEKQGALSLERRTPHGQGIGSTAHTASTTRRLRRRGGNFTVDVGVVRHL
jgi:hypothetical protein